MAIFDTNQISTRLPRIGQLLRVKFSMFREKAGHCGDFTMLQAHNSYAQDYFRPGTEPLIPIQARQDEHRLVVLVEPVLTLRRLATELISRALNGPIEVIEASSTEEVGEMTFKKTPMLIVIDLSSSDHSGIKTAAEFWRKHPETKVLFWCNSFKESHYQQIQMIAPTAGVYGIVLKSCSDERLVHAIQSMVVHENTFIDAEVRRVLKDGSITRENKLTRSEYETLCDVLLGLTDKAIAKRRSLSARGVQNRLAALFSKVLRGKYSWLRESARMDVYNLRTRLIYEVLRRGLIDTETLSMLDNELDNWISDQFGV